MQALKERMRKLDRICQNLQKTYKAMDVKQESRIQKALQQRDLNKEQDRNQSNIAGCIISKQQLKQKKLDTSKDNIKVEEEVTRVEEKQVQIEKLNTRKDTIQNQIEELLKQQKCEEQDQENLKRRQTRAVIAKEDKLLPQILKLQQEKLSLENEITSLGSKIEEIRFNTKDQKKKDEISKRNWREERKNFEQQWQDLEFNGSKIIMQSFEERLQTYLSEEYVDDTQSQGNVNEKIAIDQLSKDVEELLNMRFEDEQLQQMTYQRRLQQVYTSPLQVIEEEHSIDQSFQL